MSVSAEGLRLHLDYNAWASNRLIEASAALAPEDINREFGTADKSVLGTLFHTYAADWVWCNRVQGVSPTGFPDGMGCSLLELKQRWDTVAAGWSEWIAAQDDASVLNPIAYRDLKGNPFTQPAWMIVLHVVNHGTHHRGQVAGFLRSMGKTPPPLDLIAYYRQLR